MVIELLKPVNRIEPVRCSHKLVKPVNSIEPNICLNYIASHWRHDITVVLFLKCYLNSVMFVC